MIVEEIEHEEWVPYTDEGCGTMIVSRQESNMRLVFTAFSSLSEIVHQTTVLLYSDKARLSGRDILAVYTKYLQW